MEVAKRIDDWKNREETLEEKREKLLAAGNFLDALSAADRSVEESLNTRFLSMTFGRLSAENYKKLEEMSAVTPMLVYPVVADKGYVMAIIFCTKDYSEEAEKFSGQSISRNTSSA